MKYSDKGRGRHTYSVLVAFTVRNDKAFEEISENEILDQLDMRTRDLHRDFTYDAFIVDSVDSERRVKERRELTSEGTTP